MTVGISTRRQLGARPRHNLPDRGEIERWEHADVRQCTIELLIGGDRCSAKAGERICCGGSKHAELSAASRPD